MRFAGAYLGAEDAAIVAVLRPSDAAACLVRVHAALVAVASIR